MAAAALPSRGKPIQKFGASDRDADLAQRFDHLDYQAYLAEQHELFVALRSPWASAYRPLPILKVT